MADVLTLDSTGRVADLEGKTLEFKRDLSSPMNPLRTIVAFANSAGGRLVICVNDDGSVAGVDDPLAEEERSTGLVTDRISPQLVPSIDLVTLGEETVLVVDVPLSTRRPHCMKDQGLEAGVYVPSHASGARLSTSAKRQDEVPGEQVSKMGEQVSEQVSNVGEQALTLLSLASEAACSRTELLAGIGLSDAYGNYRRHLIPLIEGKYLARTIPDKPNSKNQRYRTTDAGRALIAGQEIN